MILDLNLRDVISLQDSLVLLKTAGFRRVA